MKQIMRALVGLLMIATTFHPITAKAVSANPTPDCTAGSTCTVTFAYTGDYYSWTVPAGIVSVTVDAYGAQGGNTPYTLGGGKGGRVQATLTVTPGATAYIYVGGQGASNADGGYNGGGTANGVTYGASGGGATHIATTPGLLSTLSGNQSSVLLVAGGGGGSGYYNAGGLGGGLTGGKGADYNATWTGGSGGTQSAGGAAGNAYCSSPVAGSFGQGGGNSSYHCTGGGGGWYGGGQGAVGGGGGGSSYTNATYSSAVTHTQGSRSGNGQVSFTYLNAPVPTTFTTTEPSRTKTISSISYAITFSQNVNSVANGDFSNAGTATGCVFSISGASGSSFTLTVSSCGEGTLIPQVIANSVYGTITSTNGPASNSLTTTPITIDRTAPTISSVSAPVNKTYIPSETPTFSVVFSESITVVGSPRLQLTVGALTRYANYVSMLDSKTAQFRYIVGIATGEFDTDGIELNTTFDLNGGRIDDLAGNSMSLTTFSAPTLTSVFVAQKASAPTITSIIPGSAQLTVNFNTGASNGAPITNYKYSLNGGAFTAASPVDTVTPLVITGLTNGTGYTVRILAVTLAGDGDSSTAVTETPSAISVTGDSTIVLTYGTSGSTGNYSASGGTNTFTWSLGSVISGVSLSGTSVNVANTLNAGTYTQTVRATDGASAVGSKQLTITITKASSTMSLALQSGGNSTPVGQSPVITITTARAGTVVFSAGGQVISACASISIASTSGTCTLPAPNSTGALSLDAVFTPTSGNYESATASISLTIIDGVSTVTLSLSGGVVEVPKGQSINILAAIDQAGKVSFFVDGKRLPGCFNKTFSVGNAVCTWKPATQKRVSIRATLDPTNNIYKNSSSTLSVFVKRRAGLR
jgi:hypothetical protein